MLHRAPTSLLFRTLLAGLLTIFLSATALSAAGIAIAGQVFGPDGEPRAKADVRLEPIPPTYERARLRLEGRPGPEPVAQTRTGTDGTFELDAPEAGMWKVVVSAPGVLATELRLIPLVDATDLPPVTLTPAADLEVRLVDAKGKPRPGAVGAVPLGARGSGWRSLMRLATAGEDGIAHLPLGKDEKIQLEVLAEGHPLAVFDVADETSVTIDLKAGVAGTVRVTDGQKRPLADAIAFQGSALLPLGSSDEEGRLHLVMQTEKPAKVRISTADRWNGSFDLDFATAAKTSKDLRLDPPDVVHGRVLDVLSRDPVAEAMVWSVRGEVTTTDEQGRYELDIGVYKSRWMQAAATGYQRGQSQMGNSAEGGEAPAIALTPAASLSGKVVDSEGSLLEGVTVELSISPQHSGQLTPSIHRMMRDGWRGRTSERGTFRVAGIPSGLSYQMTFTADGFAPHTLDVEPLEPFASRSDLRVVLEPGRLAFGQVVDEDDVPIAGAEVTLHAPPPTDNPMAAMRMMRRFDDSATEPTHQTDAEGRFEIPDLAAGRYDLEVRAGGFAPAKVPGVRVGDSRRVDFGTLVLVEGATIEGRVTDPDGAAIAGAEVTVDTGRQGFSFISWTRGQKGENKAATDAKGRFVITDLLPAQPVSLTVNKEGFGSESVSDLRPPTDEPLVIVLRAAGRLQGTVVDKSGDPIKDARVMANMDHRAMMATGMMNLRRRPAWSSTDTDGAFVLEDVEPGRLQVTIDAEGYQQHVQTGIEVTAGAVHELKVVLEAGAVVEGTVTTADGEPVAQASISVMEQREGFFSGNVISASAQTDFEGNYKVTGAPTGTAQITVYHQNDQQLEKSIEVRPGTNVVDLVLERGFEVSGQVTGPDGNPMAGANLSIQQATMQGMNISYGSPPQAVSGGGGAFTLTNVRAGKYTVTASREGYAQATSEPLEVSGDVTGLLLELSRGATLKGRVLGLEFDELGSLSLFAVSQQGGMRNGRVDFEAEYVFDSLGPGQWHIQAQVAGSGRSTTLQVEIPEGVSEVEQDLEFGTGFTLTGVVLDGGQPVAGANIAASQNTGSSGQGATGADGRFRIESLKPGSYMVMVMVGMGIQHSETLELVGDHELRIEIATGTVSGLVRGAEGEPLAGAAIVFERLDPDDSPLGRQFSFGNRAESDSRGYFQLQRVRQGTWRVTATKSGYAPGETTVAVAGGSAPEVEIRLTPTEGVSFEVALQSGIPVSSVQVAILGPASRQLTSGTFAVIEGKVRVSTVPTGQWELVVQGGDSAATRFAVNAPGDQGRLVLPTGGSLQIRVPELEQVAMANMTLTGPDGKPFISTVGVAFGPGQWLLHGGQTMVPGLVPGVWSFNITHEGRTWSGSAAVTPGATTEVSVP